MIHQSNSIKQYLIHLVNENTSYLSNVYGYYILQEAIFQVSKKQAETYDGYKNLCITRSRLMLGL